MTPELAASLRAVWRIHDEMTVLLTARERAGVAAETPQYRAAMGMIWQAHDRMERALLMLHALATPDELAALQGDA